MFRRINQTNKLNWAIFKSAALTILLCWTVIFGIYYGYKWYKNKAALKDNEDKIAYLSGEIAKLDKALANRSINAII